MTSLSKILSPQASKMTCHDLIHPWNHSCVGNALNMAQITWTGCIIYYTIMFSFQHLRKMAQSREINEFDRDAFLKQLIMSYFRGVFLFGTPMSAGCVGTICLLRNILGKFYSATTLFIPAFVGAIGIFGFEPKTRLFYATMFTNFALTVFTKRLQVDGDFTYSLLQKTCVFMALSATISGMSKLMSMKGKVKIYYWFFNPIPPTSSKESKCCHDHSCWTFLLKDFLKYFTTGALLSLLKIIFKLGHRAFTSPLMLLKHLITTETWRLPAFLGIYSLLFQGVRCTLGRISGRSTILHNALAGGMGGMAFPLHPSMTLLNSATITAVQVLSQIGVLQKYCSHVPFAELFFAVSTGILYEAAVLTPKLVPKLSLFILRTGTNGRIIDHHKRFLEKFKELRIYSDLLM